MAEVSTLAVFYIPPVSESLSYRPHLERVEDVPFLRWSMNRLFTGSAIATVAVLCHSEKEAVTLRNLNLPKGVILHVTSTFTQRNAVAELTRASSATWIAMLPWGMALAPKNLLETMGQHHRLKNNTLTIASGLPTGTTPVLFNRHLILAIDDYDVPGLPTDTLAAAQALVKAARTAGQGLPFAVRSEVFAARQVYGAENSSLPRNVPMDSPEHFERLRRILASPVPATPLGILERWKWHLVEENEAAHAQIHHWTFNALMPHEKQGPRRVLFVSTPSAFTGAEESLFQMVQQVDRKRFDLYALIEQDGVFAQRLREAGVTVETGANEFSSTSLKNLFFGLTILQKLRPDLVHVNTPSALSIVTAAKLLKIPVVLHVRNSAMDPYTGFLVAADAVVVISDFLRREILALDLSPNRVQIIPDEVDIAHFDRAAFDTVVCRKKLGIPLDAKVVLMIARFAAHKRHDLMVSALAILKKFIPGIHLVLKSDVYSQSEADLRDAVHTQIQKRGLGSAITWLRFVSDIRELHAAADVLVLCSDREGMGRCVVEAMAMQLPVVVVEGSGPQELVGTQERGYLARANDPKDLAEKIIEALTQKDQTQTRVIAARRYTESSHNAKDTAARMMGLYDRVLSQDR